MDLCIYSIDFEFTSLDELRIVLGKRIRVILIIPLAK